mmetsp:Transcript_11677/g.29530  ORF Transcript_11677/g.29530 Transcript_11677/m.29530 type:complete len:223 (+) Transcript_11677:102-770(+)
MRMNAFCHVPLIGRVCFFFFTHCAAAVAAVAQVDASKRSGHSNAYMYGFFNNKRIVLYDTLLGQCADDEILAILAHELGHWKCRHTPILFVLSMTVLLLQLSLYTFVSNSAGLFESFGFHDREDRPALIGLILFSFISGPSDVVIEFLSNILSRRFEFQADRFAVRQGLPQELASGLVKLHKENKSNPNIDFLYSTYHFSHPPLVERLRAIQKEADARKKDK